MFNLNSSPARALPEQVLRGNPRALPEIKDNRLPLHKHPVSTSPFPLTPAFLQPSASRERSDIPRPCLKKQGRRGRAFPWGGSSLPEGRTFPSSFRSLGKRTPRGERKTNNNCLQKIRSKTSILLQIKNKHYLQIIRRPRSVHLSVFPARCRVQFSPPPSILRNSG